MKHEETAHKINKNKYFSENENLYLQFSDLQHTAAHRDGSTLPETGYAGGFFCFCFFLVNWEFSRPSALTWSTCFFFWLKKVLIFPQFIINIVLQSPSWQVAAGGCCTKNLIVIIILSELFFCMKDTTFTSTSGSLDLLFVLNFSVSLPLSKCLQTSFQTTNLTVATW